ncbi:two-component system, OmpR family, sensor histidine kinase BaeS [Modicisalibacter muralis]|uniref:histidine kinase n=1 Tax=Modicisalibacter muralis TaxID=119000 RepID=A0A1G9I572_9GAMM|nr:ATP-binding protein [Halomonas muralis]SDL20398.1 two-component system, OmpR family, sensor histidine kinase BaeS [Halomonas muralis]
MKSFTRPNVSRLGLKLFVTILLVNVGICGLIFVFVSRSLDQGFIDYLERTQTQRAEILASALGEEWALRGNWQWLRDNPRAWSRLVYQQLWPNREQQPPGLQRQLGDPRDFVLRDSQDRVVISPPSLPLGEESPGTEEPLRIVPIVSNGRYVGELGYRPPRELMARMDRIFLSRQQRNLSIIVGSLALASLLLAGVLSWWLGRRTRGMALATRRLTEGDYSVRLRERGRDELARLAHDFNVLAETLEANRESRQRWVADIAHELRTPLAVLRGEIEAMQDGIRPLDHDSLYSLSQEAEQLERLVADLRLLAQSDAGSLQTHLEPLDLASSLHDRLEEARGWLHDAGITLEISIAASAPIRGDRQRLRQLWTNLLTNTRAYTDVPGHLKVSLTVDNQRVWVRWEDSAPGVTANDLPRLTERLYRVEASRNRRRGGSGLGLSIASALTHAHGGMLKASPSPLGGLCWTLSFPLNRG